MDVEICIQEENVGTNNSIQEEVKEDEGGALKEMSVDEMDPSNEEEIWRSRRERIDKALQAARNAEPQDPSDQLYAAARRLADVIKEADVEEFISEIERLANQTDPSAIFNFLRPTGSSLLHIAVSAGKDDILRLLLDCVPDHLIAAQNNWGHTPLHTAVSFKRSKAAEILIRRIRDLPNIEDKNRILRMKNKHGNTALHEAVSNGHVDGVRCLLNEDLELVYSMCGYQACPVYLAVQSEEPEIQEILFSLPLEPSRMQGLPPIHGAILSGRLDLAAQILEKNVKLFTMTDSRGGNVFHLAAYLNWPKVFEIFEPKTKDLAQQHDINGDLPIHIASKMGYVELIEKLLPVSQWPNLQGHTVLHVAAKYGRTSAVRYMLRHPQLETLINASDHSGNTPLHLAAMYSQPAALIPFVMDERIKTSIINHESLTALDIARQRYKREPTLRKRLTLMVLSSSTSPAVSTIFLVRKPEARDEAFLQLSLRRKKKNMDLVKDAINIRLLVATLVATVTFAAGFAVPGGFNGSDTTSKDDRGMATMLNKRLFQAFTICNTIAMFCSMIVVINLIYAQQNDVEVAIVAGRYSVLPLTIALPAMSVAFLAGVTLTVSKLPWLANTIFYVGLVFLLIISGAALILYPPMIRGHHRPIRRLIFWLVLAYIYLWNVETYLLDDLEEEGTRSGTLASRPPEGAGDRMTDDSATAKCGDAPHPPSH